MPEFRALLILNPVSGRQDYDSTKGSILERLAEKRVPYEIRETEGEGDAMKWAEEARGFSVVIVGGGDGTVMEVMTGMTRNPEPVPVAQLPLGTANLLARALAIPRDLEEAIDLALDRGFVIRMDVGYLPEHERYFALVAGSGWDAQLIEDADREMKNRLGFFAYVFTGIRNLFRLRDSRITLTVDEKVHRFRAHTIEVINIGEIYGTGIALGRDMSPHDGRLDIAIASSESVFDIFKILFRIILRRFDHDANLRYFTASNVTVEADPPLHLQADGEPIGETPYRIEVVPNGVNLVVPQRYIEAKKLESEALRSR